MAILWSLRKAITKKKEVGMRRREGRREGEKNSKKGVRVRVKSSKGETL